MKAVNLIPSDAPKGEGGRFPIAGDGVGAYVVLGMLAVAVVMVGAWALTNRQISAGQSKLAGIEREAHSAEARAASLKPYTEFAALRTARVATIDGLLEGRFDWAHSLREVARVVPADVALTSLIGTVSPTSQVEGSGSGGSLRSALPVPAIDLIGCAKSQAHVARLLARLRAIDGVERVTLASSEKSESASTSDTECRTTEKIPQFQLTLFYKALEGLVPAADAGAAPPAGGTPAPASATPAPAAGGKPAPASATPAAGAK